MATRGFLIRFIDIGLIVLFGFLMISDIEAASRVELAGSGEDVEETVEPRDDLAFVVVEIGADGAFIVGRRGPELLAPETLQDPGGPGEEDEASEAGGGDDPYAPPRTRVTSVGDLEDVVRDLADAHRSEGLGTVVLIEPHPASAVQRTVDVMDVSDRLGLRKSLRMDIELAPVAADPGDSGPTAPSDSADPRSPEPGQGGAS